MFICDFWRKIAIYDAFYGEIIQKNRESFPYCKGQQKNIVNGPTDYWAKIYNISSVDIFVGWIV